MWSNPNPEVTTVAIAPPPVAACWNPNLPSSGPASLEVRLISRITQGDHEAFAALYDLYAKPLYSFVLRVLGDAREAEDVLQEVFLSIWQKAPSFSETLGKPFNWAVTMTRHKAIDRLRARQRKLRLVEEMAGDAGVAEASGERQRDENLWRDQAEQVRKALTELPQAQRGAIELSFFSGFTHPEIARALAQPLGTIKARIRRGMLRLREGLEEASVGVMVGGNSSSESQHP